MAIFSKYLIASSVLSAIALAAPLIPRAIVTDIVTETVWTTLDVTTTIYDNATPATTAPAVTTPPAAQMAATETSTSTPTTLVPTTPPAAPLPSSTLAAEFFRTPTAAGTAPQTSSSAAQASHAATSPGITASASGTCEGEGNACVGDVTHWDGGLGACGTNVDTNSDLAIALPYQFMGTASNNNPYCGRSVTLYNPTSGTTVQAVVKDKCMGCVSRAIDCTDILFNQITDGMGDGRMSGIEWWLN